MTEARRLNENHLQLAYGLLAILCCAALVALHTFWKADEGALFSVELEHPAQYVHSGRLVYLLSLVLLGFMRVAALRRRQKLGYPYGISCTLNLAALVCTLWVGMRGVEARSYVVQDYHPVAIVFCASLFTAMIDFLAMRAHVPTTGKVPLLQSVIAFLVHVVAVVGVCLTTLNLEFQELPGV